MRKPSSLPALTVLFPALTVLLLALTFALPVLASVTTYHNSNRRHGLYVVPGLTPAAAATMHRDPGFAPVLDGHIYAQPLYWRPPGTKRGQIIVATENNVVYALDELTGAVTWQTRLAPPVPLAHMPCGNIDPMGITGTPVIDPATGVVYMNAQTQTAEGPRHMVYALSLSNGALVPGWPLDVQAEMTNKGLVFDSKYHGERSALLFVNGRIYVNYAGNSGDCGVYHGTVLEFQPSPPALLTAWQTRATRGGIWAQGGIASDGQGLYATTGNTTRGTSEWSDGEAILRLREGLAHSDSTKDFFTPSNWEALDDDDRDLGGTEAIPINILKSGGGVARRVIAFGKDGNAYLVDRVDMGGIGGQIATLQISDRGIRNAPSAYQTTDLTMIALGSNSTVDAACNNKKNLTVLKVAAGGPDPVSFAWCQPVDGAGAPIITTTDRVADPIAWMVGAEGDNMLHGFNLLTGEKVSDGGGFAMSGLHHFVTILATHRRLYVAADDTVYAFAFTP